MCQDPNKGAADAARMRNARTMYEWGNKKASYHSKEATGKTFADAAVIGFSRTRGAGQENAMRMAGEGRIRKAALAAEYATQQRVDEGGGSRTAGRNQFLSLLAKNSAIERAVNESWGIGMQKNELAGRRQLQGYRNKIQEKYGGPPPVQPLFEPVPGPDRMGQIMDGIGKVTKIASVVAAPMTGGASLGISGLGKGAGSFDLFGGMFGGNVKGNTTFGKTFT